MITLFGGEPTLHKDRFIDICTNVKIFSISTNLLYIDEDIMKIMSNPGVGIATSWNMTRFTPLQFSHWIGNLKQLSRERHDVMVLVTMTPDLIQESSFDKVLAVLNEIDQTQCVESVLFEHLVSPDATAEFH